MMYDAKPNSNALKDKQEATVATEDRKIEKVVSGPVTVKKKKGISRLAELFISEDASNIKHYVTMEVLIPAIKKAVDDIVSDGIHMLLYGGTGRVKSSSPGSKVSYSSCFDNSRYSNNSYRYDEPKPRYSYDTIIIPHRGDAEMVLERMHQILAKYRLVRVADFYDLVGVTGEYTDNRYGWTNLDRASIVRVRDGYQFDLPRPMPID